MAITTLDGVIAGLRPLALPTLKSGSTMGAANALRMHSYSYVNGVPAAATAPTPGVNGQAVTPANFNGALPRVNPVAPDLAYVGRVTGACSQVGALWLIDRLWHNSGLSPTLTTAQTMTPVALPSRDNNGTGDGEGVLAALEWSGVGGAGTPTVTISYTNSDGVAGRTATLTGLTAPPVGTVEVFSLQAGDKGVRSVQSLTQSATRTSGTYHLVLFRPVTILVTPVANAAFDADPITGGMARIFDDAALQWWLTQSATTGASISCTLRETVG